MYDVKLALRYEHGRSLYMLDDIPVARFWRLAISGTDCFYAPREAICCAEVAAISQSQQWRVTGLVRRLKATGGRSIQIGAVDADSSLLNDVVMRLARLALQTATDYEWRQCEEEDYFRCVGPPARGMGRNARETTRAIVSDLWPLSDTRVHLALGELRL